MVRALVITLMFAGGFAAGFTSGAYLALKTGAPGPLAAFIGIIFGIAGLFAVGAALSSFEE